MFLPILAFFGDAHHGIICRVRMLGDIHIRGAVMIVYGEAERLENVSEVQACIQGSLRQSVYVPTGVDRHAALVGAFIRAGELVQGVADAEFLTNGHDVRSAMQEVGAKLLLAMAKAIDLSWRSGFQDDIDAESLIHLVRSNGFSGFIRTRAGEGFAHYAVYPESYLEVARASGLPQNTCVIGIRSIGTALAALVAAALNAAPAISVRPTGYPFDRRIRADCNLIGRRAADRTVNFAIVDEGPGLSGSSFASVARWLLEQGVEADRIHFFPSHEGQPGPSASREIRGIWDSVARHPASRHDVVLHALGLSRWVEANIGPLQEPLRDVTCSPGEAWRRMPHDARFARRKLMVRAAGGNWLAKFAGLGPVGERKFHDARLLGRAGFGPEAVALCHGFIVQKWIDGQPPGKFARDRDAFLHRLGAFLAFRARNLGAPGPGASPGDLREMAIHNAAEALGAAAAVSLTHRLAKLEALRDHVRPIRTDNRLHAWEWLATENGFIKLDGVDHCEGHDLIGCQDIAWDLAGSIVEYGLDQHEVEKLCRIVKEIGVIEPDRELISALLPCYLAFQLGLWSTATPPSPATKALADSYATKLAFDLRMAQPIAS
jgi:hypothetical protein